jgi:hypothetical protein
MIGYVERHLRRKQLEDLINLVGAENVDGNLSRSIIASDSNSAK